MREWKLFLFLPHAFFPLSLTHAHTDHLESLTPAALTPACFLAPSLCFHAPHFTPDHLKLCPPYLKSTLMFKSEEQGRREEEEEVKCKRGLMWWWWWDGWGMGADEWSRQEGGGELMRVDEVGWWEGRGGEERGGRERATGGKQGQWSSYQYRANEEKRFRDKNVYNETRGRTSLYKWRILRHWHAYFFVVFLKLSLDVLPPPTPRYRLTII